MSVDLERRGRVAILTLNRPDALNALDSLMVDELRGFLGKLAGDRETRVVVIRGAGRAFCAGLDLKESRPSVKSLAAAFPTEEGKSRSGPGSGCATAQAGTNLILSAEVGQDHLHSVPLHRSLIEARSSPNPHFEIERSTSSITALVRLISPIRGFALIVSRSWSS